MKKIMIFIFTFVAMTSFGAEEKKYTQKEFDEKVNEEVLKRVEKIKTKSISQLTKELIEKENKLQETERNLKQQEEQIKINEETLAKKIMGLEEQQKKLIGCVDEHQKGEARRIKQMVSVISSMKPAKAAEVLSVQDSQISVKILEQIDPQRASKIFNLMDKEVSARLQKQYLNMQK